MNDSRAKSQLKNRRSPPLSLSLSRLLVCWLCALAVAGTAGTASSVPILYSNRSNLSPLPPTPYSPKRGGEGGNFSISHPFLESNLFISHPYVENNLSISPPSLPLPNPPLRGEGSGAAFFTGKGAGGLGSFQAATDAETQPLPQAELLQQGQALYEAGKYAQAAEVWKQAASFFEAKGDRLRQAIALSNLSLACQQQGQWNEATGAIAQSLELLQGDRHIRNAAIRLPVFARSLDIQGRLHFALGESEKALAIWEHSADIYWQVGDETNAIASSINQAQALQALGLYSRAKKTLNRLNNTLLSSPDSLVKVAELRSLGNALRVSGDLKYSEEVLQQSLAIAEILQSPQASAETLLYLGNTARAQRNAEAALSWPNKKLVEENTEKALRFYQQADKIATFPATKVLAQLNQFSLLMQEKRQSDAKQLLPAIEEAIAKLPPSRTAIYAEINLAINLLQLEESDRGIETAAEVLARAVREAKSQGDKQAESYALGYLGELYEKTQQYDSALDLTQQALVRAQAINAWDIGYRWQWQLGRLLRNTGDISGAIDAYTEAVKTLKTLRSDLVAINTEVQYSFRETVEPVYRELVDLLLKSEQPSQENLKRAREAIESLQLAELDNFFRDGCLDAKPKQIDEIDPTAAVIYAILLNNRIAIILSLPGKPLHYYATSLPKGEDIQNTLVEMRKSINPTYSSRKRLELSQEIYNCLIRPIEAQLSESQIKTLVFVLDGSLRNIPMAALHDGQQYLVEKYAIAFTPGLHLLEPQRQLSASNQTLIGGLSEARQGFAALPAVNKEVTTINSQLPSQLLLNGEFTSPNLQSAMTGVDFGTVHLATHGQFSSKVEETFIVTWDAKINVKQLSSLLRTRDSRSAITGASRSRHFPLELLVLSACQTAAGDSRSVLGLAGIAVRSGARSTLATLWLVDDPATAELMIQFYRELSQPGTTKAEALRRAQLAFLKSPNKHPYFWASFILVGNWL